MQEIFSTAIKVALILFMGGLGLGLTLKDFARLVERPKSVFIGAFCQIVVLPCVALMVAVGLDLDPKLGLGMILLGLCPGGATSNFFSYLAKADVALSVTLTGVSSALNVLTLPIAFVWLGSLAGYSRIEVSLPVLPVMLHIACFVLLPMVVGMLALYQVPRVAKFIQPYVIRTSLVILLSVIVAVMYTKWAVIIHNIPKLGIATVLLMVGAMSLSGLIAKLSQLNSAETKTVTIEVCVQNAAQAMAIANSPAILNDPEIAIPAIIYGLVMYPIIMFYLAFVRSRDDQISN